MTGTPLNGPSGNRGPTVKSECCHQCKGSGRFILGDQVDDACARCGGSGREEDATEIKRLRRHVTELEWDRSALQTERDAAILSATVELRHLLAEAEERLGGVENSVGLRARIRTALATKAPADNRW